MPIVVKLVSDRALGLLQINIGEALKKTYYRLLGYSSPTLHNKPLPHMPLSWTGDHLTNNCCR